MSKQKGNTPGRGPKDNMKTQEDVQQVKTEGFQSNKLEIKCELKSNKDKTKNAQNYKDHEKTHSFAVRAEVNGERGLELCLCRYHSNLSFEGGQYH